MISRRVRLPLLVLALSFAPAPPALALANRVFVSARSGNNANSCDNILTPCQTFAGAVLQLNPGGEAIVLDSGGYGPVTITQSVTIEAPAGVTAFIHPPSGDAITVNAGSSDVVTLRGLVLNVGTNNGITVNSVGTLNVENCFITGFGFDGIFMASSGRLNVKGTDIKNCVSNGIHVMNGTGSATTWIDHCHLDGNGNGFQAATNIPGSSMTIATYSSANGNFTGWICGNGLSSGRDLLVLECCTGSGNGANGLFSDSGDGQTRTRYSNCVFADNGAVGVGQAGTGVVESRGNNTFMGNSQGATNGTVGSFSAQ